MQYNSQQALTEYYGSAKKIVPSVVTKLEKHRQMKIAATTEARAIKGRARAFRRSQDLDKRYGPNSQKPDLEPAVCEQFRENHLLKLAGNAENWKQIERDTRDQSKSDLWMTLRKQMLTASNFGAVCQMRPSTSCAARVREILYPPISDAVALRYGHDYEDTARRELKIELKKEIRLCGLFIDQGSRFVGAAPTASLMKMAWLKLNALYRQRISHFMKQQRH